MSEKKLRCARRDDGEKWGVRIDLGYIEETGSYMDVDHIAVDHDFKSRDFALLTFRTPKEAREAYERLLRAVGKK